MSGTRHTYARRMQLSAGITRQRGYSLWLLIVIGWGLFGVAHGAIWTFSSKSPSYVWHRLVPIALGMAAVWALCTPLIFSLAKRITPARVGWVSSVTLHAIAALGVAVMMSFVRWQLLQWAFPDSPARYLPSLLFWLDVWVFMYLTLVVIGRALHFRRRFVDRTLRAERLEAQLTRAQMQYLESQLQPHFLFNALNTIQELAHEAPERAARMLRRLRALLAISLERFGQDEVTLEDELAALEPYLDIQRTRFSDWLDVKVDVPPRLRAAMVPHLLLQPLVENAIQHGLSVRSGPGLIVITAKRVGDALHVSVEDDGVGLPGEWSRRMGRQGIGLQNVGDRLRQLYGEDHEFALRPRSGESTGVVVDLRIPFREGSSIIIDADDDLANERLDDPAMWRTGEFSGDVSYGIMRLTSSAPSEKGATPSGRHPALSPDSPDGDASPALKARGWLGIAGVWLLLSFLWTNQMVLLSNSAGMADDSVWSLAKLQLVSSAIWLILSLPILWLARRLRLTSSQWMVRLPIHIAAAWACGFVHVGGMRLMGVSLSPVFSANNVNPITGDFFIYLGLLAWSHSRDFVAWYRAKDLDAARLTAQIAKSRFHALRIRLRPEFLLDTLDRLALLVRTDVPRAERLITRLADTLRLTLDVGRQPETMLAKEMSLVRSAIETHRLAARPALQLKDDLSLETLTDLIPSRLVCALVDELLASLPVVPDAPLTVHIDSRRISGATQIAVRAEAHLNHDKLAGAHWWWKEGGVAGRAIRNAGPMISVLTPDASTVLLMIGRTAEARMEDSPPPARFALGAS